MKNKNKSAIIIVSILLFLVIIAVTGGITVGFSLKNNNQTQNFNQKYKMELIDEKVEIASLTIKNTSDDIEFLESFDDKLHIEYYTYDDEEYNYYVDNGTAVFEKIRSHVNYFNFGTVLNKPAAKIYVPLSLKENLNIDMASGNITSVETELNINKADIKLTSGDINIRSLNATDGNVKTNSGYIKIENGIFSNNLTIESTSGDLTSENISAKKFKRTSSSGISTISINSETADIKSTSGDIKISDSTVSRMLRIESQSGYLKATNIEANTVIRTATSGNTDYDRLKSVISEIECDSGEINITDGVFSESLTIESDSGDLNAANVEIGKLIRSSTSGNSNYTDSKASSVDMVSSSGDVTITNGIITELMNIESESGDLNAYLTEVKEIIRNSTSGKSEIQLTANPEEYNVNFTASSGGISITGGGINISADEGLSWGNGKNSIVSKSGSGDFILTFKQ